MNEGGGNGGAKASQDEFVQSKSGRRNRGSFVKGTSVDEEERHQSAASILRKKLGFSRKMNAFELINFCYGKTMNEIFKPQVFLQSTPLEAVPSQT